LIGTFVKARNWRLEATIKNEIESDTRLEAFKKEYSNISAEHQDKSDRYDRLNKSEQFDSLLGQRKELARLTWKKAPEVFRSEDEFSRYKREELLRLDALIDEIKAYRKDNRKAWPT
jgi:CRISPR/Cas system-associated endonuclease Cas1